MSQLLLMIIVPPLVGVVTYFVLSRVVWKDDRTARRQYFGTK
ncbi:MAG: hypothetical protein ACM3JD_04370 [Rudaea sp.]